MRTPQMLLTTLLLVVAMATLQAQQISNPVAVSYNGSSVLVTKDDNTVWLNGNRVQTPRGQVSPAWEGQLQGWGSPTFAGRAATDFFVLRFLPTSLAAPNTENAIVLVSRAGVATVLVQAGTLVPIWNNGSVEITAVFSVGVANPTASGSLRIQVNDFVVDWSPTTGTFVWVADATNVNRLHGTWSDSAGSGALVFRSYDGQGESQAVLAAARLNSGSFVAVAPSVSFRLSHDPLSGERYVQEVDGTVRRMSDWAIVGRVPAGAVLAQTVSDQLFLATTNGKVVDIKTGMVLANTRQAMPLVAVFGCRGVVIDGQTTTAVSNCNQ